MFHGGDRTVLAPYYFGDAHWALAHVLCLVGAVLGGVASFAYSAHANTLRPDGAPDWLVSTRSFPFLCMQGPLHTKFQGALLLIFRARWWRQPCTYPSASCALAGLLVHLPVM